MLIEGGNEEKSLWHFALNLEVVLKWQSQLRWPSIALVASIFTAVVKDVLPSELKPVRLGTGRHILRTTSECSWRATLL